MSPLWRTKKKYFLKPLSHLEKLKENIQNKNERSKTKQIRKRVAGLD